MLNWPAYSPNLSPGQNMWHFLNLRRSWAADPSFRTIRSNSVVCIFDFFIQFAENKMQCSELETVIHHNVGKSCFTAHQWVNIDVSHLRTAVSFRDWSPRSVWPQQANSSSCWEVSSESQTAVCCAPTLFLLGAGLPKKTRASTDLRIKKKFKG